MPQISDEKLVIQQAQRGDMKSFTKLLQHYQHLAFKVAVQIVGNADDAKDVCQESFIKVHQNLPKYKPDFKFSTWLYRIVVNTALDLVRRQKQTSHVALKEDLVASGPWEGADLHLSLNKLLGQLSPKQRSAFILRDLQGFPLDEVKTILACSAVTARVHLHGARRRLRKLMEEEQ